MVVELNLNSPKLSNQHRHSTASSMLMVASKNCKHRIWVQHGISDSVKRPAHVARWSKHSGAMCSRAWHAQWPRFKPLLRRVRLPKRIISTKSYRPNRTNRYWPAVQCRPPDCRRARPGGDRPPTRVTDPDRRRQTPSALLVWPVGGPVIIHMHIINRVIIPGRKKGLMVSSTNCDCCRHFDLVASGCWPRWRGWSK